MAIFAYIAYEAELSLFIGNYFSSIISAIQNVPSNSFDLALGMFIVFCAITPYALCLIFPKMMMTNFFVSIYKPELADTPEVRNAEIYWKCMFATLSLVSTSLLFLAALNDTSPQDALRDCYVFWAMFYIAAACIIRRDRDMIVSRVGIQTWHFSVAAGLTAVVLLNPAGWLVGS